MLQTLKSERYRLSVVVEELKNATTTDYKTALVAFVNCLIISAPRLPERTRVRNEFIGEFCLEPIIHRSTGWWKDVRSKKNNESTLNPLQCILLHCKMYLTRFIHIH